jgi:hypothetical protein
MLSASLRLRKPGSSRAVDTPGSFGSKAAGASERSGVVKASEACAISDSITSAEAETPGPVGDPAPVGTDQTASADKAGFPLVPECPRIDAVLTW